MWTGHWGPSLILKTITPNVPLGVLFFTASLPDFVAFLHVLLGLPMEYLALAEYLPGCFKYFAHMPFTHSLAGNAMLALLASLTYYLYSKSKVGATSVFLSTLSHFPLEIPGHRKDLRILPTDEPTLGFGLFNSQLITFLLEGAVVGLCYYHYLNKTSPLPGNKIRSDKAALYLGLFLAIQHVLFVLNATPTVNVQLVHAPMFLIQILATSLLAQVVDNVRTDRLFFWSKADYVKRDIYEVNYYSSYRDSGKATV